MFEINERTTIADLAAAANVAPGDVVEYRLDPTELTVTYLGLPTDVGAGIARGRVRHTVTRPIRISPEARLTTTKGTTR